MERDVKTMTAGDLIAEYSELGKVFDAWPPTYVGAMTDNGQVLAIVERRKTISTELNRRHEASEAEAKKPTLQDAMRKTAQEWVKLGEPFASCARAFVPDVDK